MKNDDGNLSTFVNGKSNFRLQTYRHVLRDIGKVNQKSDDRRQHLAMLLHEHREIIKALELELETLKTKENEQLDKYLEAYEVFRTEKREVERNTKSTTRRSERLQSS